MYQRSLSKTIQGSLKKKSVLLLGPRQTGKSTLSYSLSPKLSFDLSHEPTFLEFSKNPEFLESEINRKLPLKKGLVFIDEVQRSPRLLNTIQYLIDHHTSLRFLLTGSSARKLRRGQANLLPGRLHNFELGSLISSELNYNLDNDRALSMGTLPGVYIESDKLSAKKLLKSYASTYLSEEIKAEALTKNLDGFTRFLFQLAAEVTHFLDLSKISRKAAVPRQTVQRFFEITEDTLIIKRCDTFAKSDKRRLVQHPRFFLFDNGVLNALLGHFDLSLDRKGFLFENLFFNQLTTSLSYSNHDYRLSSFRTDSGAEIDFILELEREIYAIEVKSGGFDPAEMTGFKSFEAFLKKPINKYVVTLERHSRQYRDIKIMPWQKFLKELDL